MIDQLLGTAQSNIFFLIVIVAGAAMALFYLLEILKKFGVVIGAILIVIGLLTMKFGREFLTPLRRAVGYAISPIVEMTGVSGSELVFGMGLILIGLWLVYRTAKF